MATADLNIALTNRGCLTIVTAIVPRRSCRKAPTGYLPRPSRLAGLGLRHGLRGRQACGVVGTGEFDAEGRPCALVVAVVGDSGPEIERFHGPGGKAVECVGVGVKVIRLFEVNAIVPLLDWPAVETWSPAAAVVSMNAKPVKSARLVMVPLTSSSVQVQVVVSTLSTELGVSVIPELAVADAVGSPTAPSSSAHISAAHIIPQHIFPPKISSH